MVGILLNWARQINYPVHTPCDAYIYIYIYIMHCHGMTIHTHTHLTFLKAHLWFLFKLVQKDREMSKIHVKKAVGMGPLPSHAMIETTETEGGNWEQRKKKLFSFSFTFVDHNSAVEKMALHHATPSAPIISAFSIMPNSLLIIYIYIYAFSHGHGSWSLSLSCMPSSIHDPSIHFIDRELIY